jgi:hypothetical protein
VWSSAARGRALETASPALLSGNLTGKFAILGGFALNPIRNRPFYQVLEREFPKKANREFLRTEQGISNGEQGIHGTDVSADFSHTCLMPYGRDLFSPQIAILVNWRYRDMVKRRKLMMQPSAASPCGQLG